MKITIIGVGYVGLVSGISFSEMGNRVVCVDIDKKKIEDLKQGRAPIYEPGLTKMIMRNHRAERLHFTTDLKPSVEKSHLLFITVGTPPKANGQVDLSCVFRVAEDIGKYINEHKIVVIKSTVPIGSSQQVQEIIKAQIRKRVENTGIENIEFDMVSNPEFLKEGTALKDFMCPDRIVIGTHSEKAKKIMGQLYAPFLHNDHSLLTMDLSSSELTKYAANAMLATKISFMNEISRICEKVGADIQKVRHGIGADQRIGLAFTCAGLGYGGSCFPKDIKALSITGHNNNEKMVLLNAVEEVNRTQRIWFEEKIINHFNRDLRRRKVALWGLAFKPGTDDVREAPSMDLIQTLLKYGAQVIAYDPVAIKKARKIIHENPPQLLYTDRPYQALEGADALVLATEWREFQEPDFEQIKELMNCPCIFDGRNQYDLKVMEEQGFHYTSVGRQDIKLMEAL